MSLVVFAAVDCLVVPVADHFAAALPLGFALQAALLLLRRSQGRWRYFWAGFEVVGGSLLITFFVCRTVIWATMCLRPSYLFDNPYSPIDIHEELMVYEWVISFEVSLRYANVPSGLDGRSIRGFPSRRAGRIETAIPGHEIGA